MATLRANRKREQTVVFYRTFRHTVEQHPSHWTHILRRRTPDLQPTTTLDITPYCYNHSLTLLKMEKRLPKTCWADSRINKIMIIASSWPFISFTYIGHVIYENFLKFLKIHYLYCFLFLFLSDLKCCPYRCYSSFSKFRKLLPVYCYLQKLSIRWVCFGC
jgi:hypothetical protein